MNPDFNMRKRSLDWRVVEDKDPFAGSWPSKRVRLDVPVTSEYHEPGKLKPKQPIHLSLPQRKVDPTHIPAGNKGCQTNGVSRKPIRTALIKISPSDTVLVNVLDCERFQNRLRRQEMDPTHTPSAPKYYDHVFNSAPVSTRSLIDRAKIKLNFLSEKQRAAPDVPLVKQKWDSDAVVAPGHPVQSTTKQLPIISQKQEMVSIVGRNEHQNIPVVAQNKGLNISQATHKRRPNIPPTVVPQSDRVALPHATHSQNTILLKVSPYHSSDSTKYSPKYSTHSDSEPVIPDNDKDDIPSIKDLLTGWPPMKLNQRPIRSEDFDFKECLHGCLNNSDLQYWPTNERSHVYGPILNWQNDYSDSPTQDLPIS